MSGGLNATDSLMQLKVYRMNGWSDREMTAMFWSGLSTGAVVGTLLATVGWYFVLRLVG